MYCCIQLKRDEVKIFLHTLVHCISIDCSVMDTSPDPNNNTRGEKSYSLRPRASLKRDEDDTDQDESWRPRGRTKRRSKQKGLPLSKYRRKTANARERSRMREINEAFEVLRRALPHFNPRSDNSLEKTTKIMTLRLAMKYITALDSALRQTDLDSDGESLISDSISREHSLTPTSISEQSDVFDQLFITTTFGDCPPSVSSSNPAISFFIDSLKSSRSPFLSTTSTALNLRTRKAPRLADLDGMPHLTARTLQCELSSDVTYNLPLVDSLSPLREQDYVSTTYCLPSPPLDLGDIFIT